MVPFAVLVINFVKRIKRRKKKKKMHENKNDKTKSIKLMYESPNIDPLMPLAVVHVGHDPIHAFDPSDSVRRYK